MAKQWLHFFSQGKVFRDPAVCPEELFSWPEITEINNNHWRTLNSK
jgi:hypothetical protein